MVPPKKNKKTKQTNKIEHEEILLSHAKEILRWSYFAVIHFACDTILRTKWTVL